VATREASSVGLARRSRPASILGLAALALLATCAISLALAVSASADRAPVLVYTGGQDKGGINNDFTRFGNATARSINTSAILPSNLSGNACVILEVNATAFTTQHKTALGDYINAGGKVLAIGEFNTYSPNANTTMNDLATSLGAGLQLNNDHIDDGFHTTTTIDSQPETVGVSSIRYAATASLAVSGSGRSLAHTLTGGKTFLGVQTIGQGLFLLSGDSNVFSDNSNTGYSAEKNGVLASNVCGSSPFDTPTAPGTLDRATTTAVRCDYIFAIARDRCFAIVTTRDGRTPTGEVQFTSKDLRTNAAPVGAFSTGDRCNLPANTPTPNQSTCAVEYIPPAGGDPSVYAQYLGDAGHAQSIGNTNFLLNASSVNGIASGFSAFPPAIFAAPSGPSFSRRTYGMTVRFRLRAPAKLRFTVARRATGRRGAKGRCNAPTRRNRGKKKCTRYVALKGSFTLTRKAGKNKFRFRGRIGGKRLKPGRYKLIARPSVGTVRATKTVSLNFRVKRP
jgi:hypothetical protein